MVCNIGVLDVVVVGECWLLLCCWVCGRGVASGLLERKGLVYINDTISYCCT